MAPQYTGTFSFITFNSMPNFCPYAILIGLTYIRLLSYHYNFQYMLASFLIDSYDVEILMASHYKLVLRVSNAAIYG